MCDVYNKYKIFIYTYQKAINTKCKERRKEWNYLNSFYLHSELFTGQKCWSTEISILMKLLISPNNMQNVEMSNELSLSMHESSDLIKH